ncbi:cAMP-binding proteins [alpha proteobacterium U9-1i]|nr:cAMP-binding proteins [alpha proteobacterium U9-1i]
MPNPTPRARRLSPSFPVSDIARNPLFLLGEDLASGPASTSGYGPNAIIVRAGENNRLAHVVQAGWAYRYERLEDGRRQILNFLIPGDIIDIEALMFPGAPASFSVRALTELDLQTFPASDLREMAERSPEQRHAFDVAVRLHLRALGERLVDIGQRGAPGRLARLFADLHDRLAERALVGRDGVFDLPVSQDHIADALGITPVHVNRTLRSFRAAQLIEIERRRARILDRAALDRIAAG